MITFKGASAMRMILLSAALALAFDAHGDPRAPLADDGVRAATGIMAFTEVPSPSAHVHANFRYETTRVADGITTFIEGPSYAMVQGNITLITGDRAALVIDTGQYPAVAQRVIADIHKLTDKPVRYVAITHWHMDHFMANAEFADAFPGLTIIAQNFTAPMMEKYAPRYMKYGAEIDKNLQPARDMLASGKAADGSDLSADRRKRTEIVLREVDAAKPEFALMRYRGADLTFENEIDIDLGGRMVKLLHLGRGNTAGDLIAYVPDAKVLITGDIVVAPVPYSYGSYLTEWQAVLKKLGEFDATAIVPGHGPVMRDKVYINSVRELLDTVFTTVQRAWKPGMSADDVRKVVDFSKQRDQFCQGDKMLESNFKASIETAGVERAVQELEGQLKPESFDE
jgi:glyoxylase-like metal-dependent hydrolase (beta-lactamase superfamily II)